MSSLLLPGLSIAVHIPNGLSLIGYFSINGTFDDVVEYDGIVEDGDITDDWCPEFIVVFLGVYDIDGIYVVGVYGVGIYVDCVDGVDGEYVVDNVGNVGSVNSVDSDGSVVSLFIIVDCVGDVGNVIGGVDGTYVVGGGVDNVVDVDGTYLTGGVDNVDGIDCTYVVDGIGSFDDTYVVGCINGTYVFAVVDVDGIDGTYVVDDGTYDVDGFDSVGDCVWDISPANGILGTPLLYNGA